MLKWICRGLAIALCPLCATIFIGIGVAAAELPTSYYVEEGQTLELPSRVLMAKAEGAWVTQTASGGRYAANVRLFGWFPVANVNVDVTEHREVAVCGVPFGLKMFTEGVLVVGIADVDTRKGAKSPAKAAGLRVGDTVLMIDGEDVSTTSQVASLIEQSGGKTVTMRVKRQNV
ncbi:MAG: PDZ domain-containing protein, partial [Clostridia bacterium]|nr:PDZ domain-containing protein [Clostridia bacterium]